MKKIMIFYGSYGGGHLSAAKSIKDYIENNYPDTKIEMIDCVQYINKVLNKVTTKAYEEFAKKAPEVWGFIYKKSEKGLVSKLSNDSNKLMAIKLKNLLQDFSPDYVISTHPFSSQMCSYLKKKEKVNFKLATIMTDFAPHDQWLLYPEYVDYFFVAHQKMKEQLVQRGIEETKIYSTGIPLSNRFLKTYNRDNILKEFGLLKDKKTILFFGGGEFGLGKSTTTEILKILAEDFNDLQVIAIAGRNESMKKKFETIVNVANRQDSIKVLDYTNKVPELMTISDLVITKPGGLTTTESLASNLPIVIINPIPGQEEENASFLENNGVGIWIKKHDNIKEKLESILKDSKKLNEMKNYTKELSKPNSTQNICKTIFNR